jgi:hypothetical protein
MDSRYCHYGGQAGMTKEKDPNICSNVKLPGLKPGASPPLQASLSRILLLLEFNIFPDHCLIHAQNIHLTRYQIRDRLHPRAGARGAKT